MEQTLKEIVVLLTTMNTKLDTLDKRTEGLADLKIQVQEIELRVKNLEDRNIQLLKRVEALEIANTTSKLNNTDGIQPGISTVTGIIHQDKDISSDTYNNYGSVHDSDEDYDDYYEYEGGGGIRDFCNYDSDTGICEY